MKLSHLSTFAILRQKPVNVHLSQTRASLIKWLFGPFLESSTRKSLDKYCEELSCGLPKYKEIRSLPLPANIKYVIERSPEPGLKRNGQPQGFG